MAKKKELITYNSREIIFYRDNSNEIKIEVLLQNENLWLTQARIAELFGVQKAAVSKHLKTFLRKENLLKKW